MQTDVYELWLDDAQRTVSDVIELAAPRLAVTVSPTEGPGGAAALRFELARADAVDAALLGRGDARSAWRQRADIDAVTGTLVVDAASGAWLSADAQVGYSMPGPDGRRLRGRVTLAGTVTPVAASEPLPVPSDAQPLLERTRYDAERARLLDGLAGR